MPAAPPISPFVLWFFRLIVRVYFWIHFKSVLGLDLEPFRAAAGVTPLIVYGNHSSWWDPMIAVLLAAKLMPGRRHYAPMDAESLAQHWILRRIGIFPVQINSGKGAAQFIRTSLAILAEGGVVWVTPQGRFADPRELPLAFKPGLAALAARVPGGCTLLPLATEYAHWNERKPQALFHFGASVRTKGEPAEALNGRLEAALATAMQELAAGSLTRDPKKFEAL